MSHDLHCPACGTPRTLRLIKATTGDALYVSCARCNYGARLEQLPQDPPGEGQAADDQTTADATANVVSEYRSLKPQPIESPRDRQLASRMLHERLQQLGLSSPGGPGSGGVSMMRVMTVVEEENVRPQVSAFTADQQRKDLLYRKHAERAGITPAWAPAAGKR